jgi:hypothetical protein
MNYHHIALYAIFLFNTCGAPAVSDTVKLFDCLYRCATLHY